MSFCTIITANYISYALALLASLRDFSNNIKLFVLIADKEIDLKERIENEFPEITILFYDELCGDGIGKAIYEKYYHTYLDGFRWSMKPVLLNYLVEEKGIERIVYVDCDIHFYNDYKFLFDELDHNNILLSPHWRSSDPEADKSNFMQLYIYGLYNGGFVGVNSKAVKAMEWWARANLFICTIDACKGQYVDQTHLNLLPVYFEGVKSLRHKGCNVANWNLVECRRSLRNNKVFINDEEPVVFVHFTRSTIWAILDNKDPLLLPHLQAYFERLKRFGNDLEGRVKQERELKLRLKREKLTTAENMNKGQPFFVKLKSMIKKRVSQILTFNKDVQAKNEN